MRTYNQELIAMVKATGQELIDRAEELVGESELTTNFSIILELPQRTDKLYAPTITVRKEHISESALKVLCDES